MTCLSRSRPTRTTSKLPGLIEQPRTPEFGSVRLLSNPSPPRPLIRRMPTLTLDAHGQPSDPRINFKQRLDRGIHELLGLCRGVLADGAVTDAEARLLHDWIRVNPELSVAWPIDVLSRRLLGTSADGVIDSVERMELAELLREIVGGETGVVVGEYASTTLPFDRPPPIVTFEDSKFVFTGKFAFAPRSVCEAVTQERGGTCESSITKRTNFLVVGTFGSTHWAHTSFGRKILKAVDYRESGVPISIIGEDHWAAALS